MGGRSSASGAGGGSGHVRTGRGQLAEWTDNETALRQLMKDTGYTEEQARLALETHIRYYGDDYDAFTEGRLPEETRILSDSLMRMPYYDGGDIYRGISLDHDVAQRVFLDQWKPGTKQTFTDKQGNGNPIVSSFSSDQWTGESYAEWNRSNASKTSILFVVHGNKTAAGVQHLSHHGESEGEVLSPAGQTFYVRSVTRMSDSPRGGQRWIIELGDWGMKK